jgi:hypothetical protein
MFAYIASPYSSPSDTIRHKRFQLAELYTAKCLREKDWVYSPIVHCHELAQRYNLPTNAAYWLEYNYAMLERADSIRLLQLPGWEHSKGVEAELNFATEKGLQVIHIDYETIKQIKFPAN